MFIFRSLLRKILSLLSRWAIKKHQIELLVVTGWYGTEIARELLYTILSPSLSVRRNHKQIWWDFSIPLAVLGYKDKRRNPFEWLWLILKALIYLLLGKKNPHILILNADCTFDSTAKFWASFIKPDYLLILNYQKKAALVEALMSTTKLNKGIITYNPEVTSQKVLDSLQSATTFTYAKGAQANLTISEKKNAYLVNHLEEQITIPKNYLPAVSAEIAAGVCALAILKGLDLYEIGYNSLKFSLPDIVISKIKSKLAYN